MAKGPTPREVARAENIRRIKALALGQLATTSAGELSLRAIARELNLVSSALYRYYPSRDHLITALIVDAYDDLAETLEAVPAGRRGARRRWLDVCGALRAWAVAEPHRFALIYGSAIPGYRAPQETIAPAGRVIIALSAPVLDAVTEPPPASSGAPRPSRALTGQLRAMRDAFGFDLPEPAMLAVVGAFASLIGALTLELNGHFVGGFEPADDLFEALVEREATQMGL